MLDGSRLGGRLLDRRAAASPHGAVAANRSFLRHGLETRLWPLLLARLEEVVAIRGANLAFRAYQAAAEAGPPVP